MSETLIGLVKHFEGFHRVVSRSEPVYAAPYICPAGFWTIGFGSLCRQDHPPITVEQAEAKLDWDLGLARGAVLKLISTPLTQNQYDALTSWTFNLGHARLRGSTLRAIINRGELDHVPDELRKWVYGGGRKLPGLIARREAEAALWNA